MLPQPPPDAPEPPPSVAATRSRRKWTWLWVVGFFSMVIVILLFGLLSSIRHRGHHGSQSEAVNNARQIGLALFDFETEFGKFPDSTTVAAVRKFTGTTVPMGASSSNDCFRQLVGAGIAMSEPMFYARIKDARKPDGVMDDIHLLSKGEVGFSYLAGLSSEGIPSRPIVVTPLIPGNRPLRSGAIRRKGHHSENGQ